MNIIDELLNKVEGLKRDNFSPLDGRIVIQDDGDEAGAYIAKWEYSKPLPSNLKLGK